MAVKVIEPEQVKSAPEGSGAAPAVRWHPRDEEHWKRLCGLRPEIETRIGGTHHAHQLGTGGERGRASALEVLSGWRKDLELQSAESKDRNLDARVFAASLELFRFTEQQLALHKRDPDFFSPVLEALIYHLRGHAESEQARFQTLALRLRALPSFLEGGGGEATAPSAELLARARDVLDGAPDLLRAIGDASKQAQGSGAIDAATGTDVASALTTAGTAIDALRERIASTAAAPYAPIGRELLDELLHRRGLALTSAEVLDLARNIAEEMRVEQSRCIRRNFRGKSVDEAVLGARSAVPLSLGEALAWMSSLVDESRAFMQKMGMPMPGPDSERVVVDAMPTVLSANGFAIQHLPPQALAPRQESLLLLREPLGPQLEAMRELSVADLENAAAHAAYPGRHLMAVWTARTTSLARSGVHLGTLSPVAGTWGQDMVQGWALAAEELMREEQFRPSGASRLIMVRRVLLHALLAAADVCLATGSLSPEKAASFLVRRGGVRLPVARALVRSMLRAPSLGLSAFVGKVRIEQLRREAHKRWRDGYNPKRFHTLLLVAGPVPLAYLFERLADPPPFVSDVRTASFDEAKTES